MGQGWPGCALFAVLVLLGGCALYQSAHDYLTVRHLSTGVDVNRATPEEIAALPGVTERDAERIVEHRPYDAKADLVRRGVVSAAQFEEFEDRIYVGRPDEDGARTAGLARRTGP